MSLKATNSIFIMTCLMVSLVIYPAHTPAAAEGILSSYFGDVAGNRPSAYVIGQGNLLQIKIFGDAGSSQIYRVDEVGYVKHTLVGRIRLEGLTVTSAEQLMENKLNGDYIINPRVNIFVLEYSRFSILGEVSRPGTYEISGRVSLIEALSMAGGFTRIASEGKVKIMRNVEGAETVIQIDTTRFTKRGELEGEVYIEADDVIVVPKSFF